MIRFALTLYAAIIAMIMFAAFPVHAGGLDTNAAHAAGFSKLSETEKAAIIKQIAEQAAAKKDTPNLVQDLAATAAADARNAPEKVDQWLNIGERIGKMIGGAAKEVGVAVNDFVKTPVGLTAMALIVWHYMGGVIVHVFGGLLVMAVGLGFVVYFFQRYRGETIEYDAEKKDIFGRSVVKQVIRRPVGGEETAGFMIASALIVLVSLITMFTY